MSKRRKYLVATFVHDRGPDRKPLITAYTRDYNPQWDGCREFWIDAENGAQAKRLAIAARRDAEAQP